MKTLKIMIMGISGDYSKRKILPALAKFSNHFGNYINIEILGYSRSVVEKSEIEDILKKYTSNKLKITLETGSYDDITFFSTEIENLEMDEQLICYLALPPSVYLGFLQSTCLISNKDFTILIEKPFGRNLAESEEILQTVMGCHLYFNVYFVDHYLFKSTARLPIESIFERQGLKFKNIKSIKISALEELGVEGRIGYYDQTGALKDMLPHLYSYFLLILEALKINTTAASWKIQNYQKEQYLDYNEELQKISPNIESQTETYFKAQLDAYFANKILDVIFESGKKQAKKLTEIEIKFENHIVIFNIAPENLLKIYHEDDLVYSMPVIENTFDDHERMFKDLLENNYRYFIRADKIMNYWQVIDKINQNTK